MTFIISWLDFFQSNPQFKGPVDCVAQTIQRKGILGLYKGLSPAVLGTSAKAGIRFLSYDSIQNLLKDSQNGKLTTLDMMLSGLGAGIIEGITVVTPSEAIKTALIQDQNLKTPKYNGMAHGIKLMIQDRGWASLYQGLTVRILMFFSSLTLFFPRRRKIGNDCFLPTIS